MQLILPLLILLALTDAAVARPIPRQREPFDWRKYLPTLGTITLLGGLAGIVFLGTKADDTYRSIKVVDNAEDVAKFSVLPPAEQEYIRLRMGYFKGPKMSPEELEKVEQQDLAHGWPQINNVDTTREMNSAQRREWKALKMANDRAYKLEQEKRELEMRADAARFHSNVVLSIHAVKAKGSNALSIPTENGMDN